jgi:predicted PurR-regulated permease PerM
MKMIFALGTLIGWLLYEIKDFFSNGGFGHALAFNLLKIILILIITLIMGILTFAVKYIPIFMKNMLSLGKNQINNFDKPDDRGSPFKTPLNVSNKKYIKQKSF